MMYLYVGSILAIMCIYISLLIDQCPSLTRSRENLTSSSANGLDIESGSVGSFDTLKKAHISRSQTPRTSFYLRVGALVFGAFTPRKAAGFAAPGAKKLLRAVASK